MPVSPITGADPCIAPRSIDRSASTSFGTCVEDAGDPAFQRAISPQGAGCPSMEVVVINRKRSKTGLVRTTGHTLGLRLIGILGLLRWIGIVGPDGLGARRVTRLGRRLWIRLGGLPFGGLADFGGHLVLLHGSRKHGTKRHGSRKGRSEQLCFCSSFPQRRESSGFDINRLKSLDPRLRGDDGLFRPSKTRIEQTRIEQTRIEQTRIKQTRIKQTQANFDAQTGRRERSLRSLDNFRRDAVKAGRIPA